MRVVEPYDVSLQKIYKKWLHTRRKNKEPGLVTIERWAPVTWRDEQLPSSVCTGLCGIPVMNQICIRCGHESLKYDTYLLREML